MPRIFATLGPSELQPPFTGNYSQSPKTSTFTLAALGRRQSLYMVLQFCRDLWFYEPVAIPDYVPAYEGCPP